MYGQLYLDQLRGGYPKSPMVQAKTVFLIFHRGIKDKRDSIC
jgi:hypothetical protein